MKDAYVPGRCFRAERQIESRTLSLNDSILRMEYPYREEYGDGVAVQFTFVKNGLLYTRRVELRKRLPERTLDMKWEVFATVCVRGRKKSEAGHQNSARFSCRSRDAGNDVRCFIRPDL